MVVMGEDPAAAKGDIIAEDIASRGVAVGSVALVESSDGKVTWELETYSKIWLYYISDDMIGTSGMVISDRLLVHQRSFKSTHLSQRKPSLNPDLLNNRPKLSLQGYIGALK